MADEDEETRERNKKKMLAALVRSGKHVYGWKRPSRDTKSKEK